MDVHGTKLVRTLFAMATGVECVPANKRLQTDRASQLALLQRGG
jgi:hypothetical protein